MPQRRARIVQISDLHINRKVRPEVTGMLKRVLETVGPDILVVSGDVANQPVPWQMKRAAGLLREIETACKPTRTVVMPGNHDYKFWGNVGLRRFSRIPFEIYFRQAGLDRGFWFRTALAVRLACNALWWKGRAMREPLIAELVPECGVALYGLNSNTLAEMMAAGKVESRDLQRLYIALDKSEASPEFAFWYKIAVVHHHPAPIADAPTGAIAQIQDSFMIFYNAGLFVRELSRRGFNLVLHGHKHVAGFLRIACDFADHGRTVLPIAAAGTAAHPSPDDSRGHHLQIIDIFDDDTARLESWFFSAEVERKDESCTYDLQSLEDVRRRRCSIFGRLQKYCSSEIRKSVQITTDGYTSVQIEYRNCRPSSEAGLERIPLSLTAARPSYLRGVEIGPASSRLAGLKIREQGLYRFAGDIALGENRTPDKGPFDFGYQYRLMNGHVLTAEEFARHYSGVELDCEYASITCHAACELMTLAVQFPPGYDLGSLDVRVTAEYVPAPLRGIHDDRLDCGDTRLHDGETQRIGAYLRRQSDGYVLTCPQPVPGMIYKLCWQFRKPASPVPQRELRDAARLEEALARLLRMGRDAATNAVARADWQRARSILDAFGRDINAVVSGDPENFHISVMAWDDGSHRLKFICSNTEPDTPPAGDFFAGEGCAGFAFEKARYILYHSSRDPVGYFIHRHEWPTGPRLREPVVLASFPWIHNPGDERRRLVLGVVNISSTLPTTKLLDLFDAPEEKKAATMKILQDLANLTARHLLGGVE